MSQPERQLLFVYGTLKRKEYNNEILRAVGARYINEATTNHRYPLVVANGLPFVLNKRGIGKAIRGEVWSIPSMKAMRPLDRLEHHPDWYRRERVPVTSAKGTLFVAWLYFITPEYMPFDRIKHLPFLSNFTFGGHSAPASET